MKIFVLLCIALTTLCHAEKLKVASLHPLLSDIARNVGGDDVELIDLVATGPSVHKFTPTPRTLAKAKGAKLYLASGKNLETYLPKLKKTIGNGTTFLEVGRGITSIVISEKSGHYACCPGHSEGALDPHWWHSLPNLRRATSIIADAFAKQDPANKAAYKKRASAFRRKLEILNAWAKKELSKVPRNKRYLATSHAAFGYFCKEYGYKSIPIQGLNNEQVPGPKYIALAIATIRKHQIGAIFPERGNNPKALTVISNTAKVKIADPLYGDGAETIEKMFKSNVTAIVKALAK